jgi:N,N'-diacetyllegionaminate synthase
VSKSVQIIAEVGLMHDGSLPNAMKLIDAVSELGADAVKFQTHLAEFETLPNAPTPPYFKSESRMDYFRRTAFTEKQWIKLKNYAQKKKVGFLSSAFSIEAVDLLNRVGVEAYKVPSGEVTNIPYLERIAQTRRPVYLSSGMSSWKELDRAVRVFRRHGSPLTLFQCTSLYPCPYEKVGLNVIGEMRRKYRVPVGLSDHTFTNYATFAAVAQGATVIEKHFTLSRHLYGSDAAHSLEPAEFEDLVKGVRAIEKMMEARVDKDDLSAVRDMKSIFEKSLVTLVAVPEGGIFTEANVGCRKPGGGLAPEKLRDVIGRKAKKDLPAGRTLQKHDVQWGRK